jgi:hypothetical protein
MECLAYARQDSAGDFSNILLLSLLRKYYSLDYYSLPSNFSGKAKVPPATPYEHVTFLENAFRKDHHRTSIHPIPDSARILKLYYLPSPTKSLGLSPGQRKQAN